MIPMTPSSPACYEGVAGAGGEGGGGDEGGSGYWPAASVSPGVPLSTSGDEGAGGTKVRKPYTITKQRQRWTEEEHQKFLEALKLYGRAWRRIEEHIGTKTAVQIRSHAQKFFSKIERDVTAGQQQGAETGVAQVIDIPPPRPKRKPTHPYPRKAGRRTSEEECPLATAAAAAAAGGSISSSSGISTAAVVEGCSKSSSAWEQDIEDQDVAKDGDALRAWVIPRPVVTAGSSPAVAANAAPAMMSPIPAFPAAVPWARIFGGGMNPAAMVNPTMVSPAMMMPWVSAPSALENGGAVSAMAATMAAASAWWAMQGGMPPGLMHPAIGAMYMAGGSPPLAIPTPFLFPQCSPQEVTVAAASCGEAKEVPTAQDDAQEPPSSSRSSAMRRAERAQRVKELKARRMGSGNHLLSVASDICASTSGVNLTGGQVSNGSESAVNSLSMGVSLKHGLVRKEPADASPLDDENRKRVRNDPPQVPNAHLEKVRSVSGSNNLSAKFMNIEATYDEASPNDNGSCGSDNSAGAGQADGNGSRGGPSSNSSACGNATEGNDRSGFSDGSSEGEATCNVQTEKNDRSSEEKVIDVPKTKTSKKLTFNEFLPVRNDEKSEGSSRLPRTVSIDGDRKEVTERGQIAFQALFKRDTLPRTFSPPPGLALSLPSKPMNRSLSANALELRSPLRTRKDQDSAFNTWENLRGTCSASKVDRCESGVSIPSSRPTKSLEDLQSSERRRSSRKGRSHSLANNWLQLAPTSSLDDAEDEECEEDESADSGVDEKQQQAQESFVCKLDLFHQENEDDDGPGTIDVGSQPSASVSLSVGTARLKNVTNCDSGSGRSSVSTTRPVKYSGVGFVPYQRASTQAAHVEKL